MSTFSFPVMFFCVTIMIDTNMECRVFINSSTIHHYGSVCNDSGLLLTTYVVSTYISDFLFKGGL